MSSNFDEINTNIEQLANFTQWNPNPIVQLSSDGKVLYLNTAAKVQFPNLSNLGIQHALLTGLIDQMQGLMQSATNELVVFVREISFLNNIYEQQIFAIPKKSTIFVYLNDITARRFAEEKIKKFNKELEAKVLERTTELSAVNEKLKVLIKNAEQLARKASEANRAKSIFLSTMSHELRTPLNGVLGMATLLADTNLTDEQREFVNDIQTSGKALLSVLNDILEFSRMESEFTLLEIKSFNIRDMINESAEIAAAQLDNKPIKINIEIDDEIPEFIKGDREKILHILNSLLSNAVKFTSEGFININIKKLNSLEDEPRQNNKFTILFTIADSGIGISEDIKKQIFQPFMQGDGTMSRKYSGIGLGLVIAKRLVSVLGGTLAFESTEGKGSIFKFKIPLVAADMNSHED